MKILYVSTISLTINSFFKPHIEMLVNEGNQVDIACDYRELPIDNFFEGLYCQYFQIDFSRSPLSLSNIRAYKQLQKVLKNGKYDIVHCHTPTAAAITRIACIRYKRESGLKVFYTAHGFHFYKGAPLKNWLIYYPIEKACSYFTDKLITINNEDYRLAKKKMKAKEVCYVPGVGIDISKFKDIKIDRNAKRQEIGVPEDCFFLLSVGELNENKNHQIIIKALAKLKNPDIHYAIAGVGDKKDYLIELAKSLGVAEQVHLLGYRNDISELNHSADIFCFPSIREGLPVSLIEAMACGLPVIAAKNRGTNDIIKNKENGYFFKWNDVENVVHEILLIKNENKIHKSICSKSIKLIEKFSIQKIVELMREIYLR